TRQTRVPDGLPPDTAELQLDGNTLTELDAASLRALAPLRRLAKLDLSYNALRSLPPFAFANNTNLQKLCV
ncbi:leucine-rich repeat domain-containing protein, partial [Klebsiella pneumoniae]|nr:leucine-rich repeat domain-containing protein [Klebsiella pneumoniae]